MAANTTTTPSARTVERRFPRLKRPGVNPILIKELRSRMRGPRAFLILTGFLLMLSLVAFFFYKTMEQNAQFGGGPTPLSVTLGASMFMGLAFFEVFLVSFVTPALTAGTISGEREALTYEMLVATPLRSTSILIGKMVAALSYVFLLIFAAVPMLSLVFIFGGVTVVDMLAALLVLSVTTITFGTVGLFWSALLGRTGRATVMSYVTIMALLVGPFIAAITWGIFNRQTPPPAFTYLNPFAAMASVVAVGPDQGFSFFGGPFYFVFPLLTGNFGGPPILLSHPAWHWTIFAYAFIALLLGAATVSLVRPMGRRVTLAQVAVTLILAGGLVLGASQLFTVDDWNDIWRTPDAPRPLLKGDLPTDTWNL